MIEWTVIWPFLGVSMLLTIAPGPDNLFVAAQSIANGRKAGIATALGLCTGLIAHTSAAALGVSAVLYGSSLAFQAVKYAGAAYLLYMAWQAFREGREPTGALAVPRQKLSSLYVKGIVMNVLNPKVSLFFIAFLPQFANPEAGSMIAQMIGLGLLFMAQALVLFGLIALFAGTVGHRLWSRPSFARVVGYAKSVLFAAIGVRLVFAER
ncbi:LysE family translocator [Paenibacillus flagellatus]|uniref:LysE family translocator n=1 Tax=Paenibacillus flagellatus TaxID=2211139 RepID=A0A2V5K5G8_9BACL|nr:LysE family translocator [Paenibacillus flagellatus]PYI54508.1 LysE family translocator [Paenibacillus flagellatus]